MDGPSDDSESEPDFIYNLGGRPRNRSAFYVVDSESSSSDSDDDDVHAYHAVANDQFRRHIEDFGMFSTDYADDLLTRFQERPHSEVETQTPFHYGPRLVPSPPHPPPFHYEPCLPPPPPRLPPRFNLILF